MLNIRYEPVDSSTPCPCGCGARQVALTRFVDQDGEPVAVCFARYTTGHPDAVVAATISLGDFSEGSTPADRVAFALQFRADGDAAYQLTLLDASQSPWKDLALIGRTLGRDEAADHPRMQEAWQLADHVLTHDLVVKRYLRGELPPSG